MEAAARKDRNVFSAKGHPQWRRKVRIVGFSSEVGSCSFDIEGALAPTDGTGDVESLEGNIHDAASCWKVMMGSVEVRDPIESRGLLRAMEGYGGKGR